MLLFILLLSLPFTILGWIQEYKKPKKTNEDLVGSWCNAILYVIPITNICMYMYVKEHDIIAWLNKERK